MPLTGLDDIDWNALSHAYGPATTTPRDLQALTSANAEERARAHANLTASICHQGSVYPATATAVPFLVVAASIPTLPADSRRDVIALLSWIAEGNVRLRQRHPSSGDELWVQALEANLRKAAPRLVDIAHNAEPASARAWAVWFVRKLPPTRADLDELGACLATERDPVVRATIALGLSPQDALLRELITDSEEPLARLCAVAQLIPTASDLDSLLEIALACVPGSARFAEMPERSEDTDPIRLIASRVGEVSLERQIAWITHWLEDADHLEDAMYAAWAASESRRAAGRPLVAPVARMLTGSRTRSVIQTAASTLLQLGLPGVEQLERVVRSSDGELLKIAQHYVDSANDQKRSLEWDPRHMPAAPLRQPAELAASLAGREMLDPSNIQLTNALNELAAWGSGALEETAVVASVIERSNSAALRAHAEWVLAQISGDDERLVAALERAFEPGWTGFLVVRMLGDLGPRAASAVEMLREYIDRDSRPQDVSPLVDDLLVMACADAVGRIEGRA